MRSLKFHLIRAQNILCFGPDGIELHFADYGNVVQVRGLNLDNPYNEGDPYSSSNGAGKSSLQEILSIGLFGRTVKKPKKNKAQQILNVNASKGEVEVQWDDYRIVRKYTKSKSGTISCKLRLWKSEHRIWDDETEIKKGVDEIQKEVNKNIGLSHHSFCNVVIFDDSNTYSFLEADGPTKREIVENLLDLDQYREYHQNCKTFLKDLKKQVEVIGKDYDRLQEDVRACDRRLATVKTQEVNWKSSKQMELVELGGRITRKQKELEASDSGVQLLNWEKSQDRITVLTAEITDLEAKRDRVNELLVTARTKLDSARASRHLVNEEVQKLHLEMRGVQTELAKTLNLIVDLESLKEGTNCPVCHGIINRDNFGPVISHSHETADKCRQSIDTYTLAISAEQQKFGQKSSVISMMEEKIGEAESKIALFEGKIRKNRQEISELAKIPKPEGNATEQVLEAEIVELKKQYKQKKEEYEGSSPYKEIIEEAESEKLQKETERDQKAKELQDVEAEVPYYEYWQEAFGDNGIRKFVIDGIIPALNARVASWLHCLIDGRLELTFDNKLKETITRNNSAADYDNMCNGECRRINLAVSQSFAYVMMLDSGNCPSVVFLDEITGGGIDRAGVFGVYNMILELAKERQVFVTTHNEVLMSLLQGCDTITLKKQNDISSLVS